MATTTRMVSQIIAFRAIIALNNRRLMRFELFNTNGSFNFQNRLSEMLKNIRDVLLPHHSPAGHTLTVIYCIIDKANLQPPL
jgi:hypothetical protein